MRGFMVLMMALLFVIGSAVGQARAASVCPYDGGIGTWSGRSEVVDWKKYDVYRCIRGHEYLEAAQRPQDRQKRYAVGNKVCPFDGTSGMWTHDVENIDGKQYDVYRCANGHEYLDISWHNSHYNYDGDCPFDNSRGWRTNNSEVVGGSRYNVYRCHNGHEYLCVSPAQTQGSSPSHQTAPSYGATSASDYQAGLAIGSALGSALGDKMNAVRSDHDDDVNKEYDLSKVKRVFVYVDPVVNQKIVSDMDACMASVYWLCMTLDETLGTGRLEMLVDGPELRQWFDAEYAKYTEMGGTAPLNQFCAETIIAYADLLISIQPDFIARDSKYAWCNMIISAFDAKTGENVFTRKEERVHTNHSSTIYTEKDVVYKTVHDYAEKLAKLIKRASK